jgi:hypothetical protein
MKNLYTRAAGLAFALALASGVSLGQRTPNPTAPSEQRPADAPKAAPAPPVVKAKYEGGMLGYPKQEGWITLDDLNQRLVFQNKERRELFPIPYNAILAAWPDTKSQRSTAGQVIAATVPYGLGLPALLMKSKSRYLVIQYRDPDTRAEGVTSFKVATTELVASVLRSLAEKAQLTARGDAYVRRTDTTTPAATKTSSP